MPRLHEAVLDRMLELVRSGEIKPGDRFPSERSLASDLQVSPIIIREAFRILEYAGMVRTKQGKRRVLVSASPISSLLGAERVVQQEVGELRVVFEAQVARLAAERRTESDLRALESVVPEGPGDELIQAADMRYHLLIARATHNLAIVQVQELINRLRQVRYMFPAAPGARAAMFEEHTTISEAIASGDPDRAAEAIRVHLRHGREMFERWQLAGNPLRRGEGNSGSFAVPGKEPDR